MQINFSKYQGTGNDFVIIDNRNLELEQALSQESIAWLCHRRLGVGADGLMLLSPSDSYDFRMIYYNADGKEGSMCGNGGRCLVAFAHQIGLIADSCIFEAIDGLHKAYIRQGQVELEMISPHGHRHIGPHKQWIDTGSPHYVWFREDSIEALDVVNLGKEIRYSEAFADMGGTNVNFAKVQEAGVLEVRTYERGVEDETLSCGTGVTACAYTYLLDHPQPTPDIQVLTRGGKLSVRIEHQGTDQERIFLCGPATLVFEGSLDLAMGPAGNLQS